MEIMELMRSRHSVRRYLDKKIPEDIRKQLKACAAELNAESGLNMQIIFDDPDCFDNFMAHYGNFEGCSNYISMTGKKGSDLDEKCGFFGEKLVLKAQELGLNTCWAKMSHGKSRAAVGKGEKETILISLGFGKTQGHDRKSKSASEVSNLSDSSPEWFRRGVEAALIAPTAVNQQKFFLELKDGGKVAASAAKIGPCLKIDLGIVKCHFELAAGKENFEWEM